jgi:hypothetical protein
MSLRTHSRFAFLFVAWLLVASLGARHVDASSRPDAEDPIARLEALMQRVRERRVALEGEMLVQAKGFIADTRLTWSIDPSRANDAALAMLDVMGLFLDAPRNPPPMPSHEADLRDAAVETLQAHMSGDFPRWLATDVLSMPRTQPLERRLAVARLFENNTVTSAKLALLGCTHERDPRMRIAARRALVGWEDDVVHALFLAEIEKPLDPYDTAARALAEKHFSQVHFDAKSKVAPRYTAIVRVGLLSKDWRTAVRAAVLQKPVENELMVPELIEALSAWKVRGDAGAQSLRVRFEISRALRERSGRSLGLDPEAWRSWWALVHGAEGRALAPMTPGGVPENTEATFFGLRITSDRIVFVIDRSGSMESPFGPGTGGRSETGHRRWDEAVAQLVGVVEGMGPKGRFDVVVFHDIAESWKGALVPASPENVRAIKDWLRAQRPNGGTHLRAGIDSALHVKENGEVDLAKLEADTVIVLCDGQTEEGAGWVDAFLDAVGPVTRVVFHGVQIGSQGDETMIRLAKGTRGDFVRIDG